MIRQLVQYKRSHIHLGIWNRKVVYTAVHICEMWYIYPGRKQQMTRDVQGQALMTLHYPAWLEGVQGQALKAHCIILHDSRLAALTKPVTFCADSVRKAVQEFPLPHRNTISNCDLHLRVFADSLASWTQRAYR